MSRDEASISNTSTCMVLLNWLEYKMCVISVTEELEILSNIFNALLKEQYRTMQQIFIQGAIGF